jgi:hypothetical protein
MKKNFINIVYLTNLALAGVITGIFNFIVGYFLNRYNNKNDKN